MRVVAVVGHLRQGSRTRSAAELVAQRLTGAMPGRVIEVIEFADKLLGWGDDPVVADAKGAVAEADLVIVASPTFKATYTGVLKLFLDRFAAGELADTTAIPLMLGAGPHHALAPELTLKPVLVEIGCSCPTPALYLLDSDYEESARLDEWLPRARASLPGVAAP